jgi:hypothetical protein
MTTTPNEVPQGNVDAQPGQRRNGRRTTINIDQIHNNTSQEIIHITSDKLRLALMGHLDCLAKRNAWHVPLSLFASVIVVFFTSTFKDAFGIKADKLEFAFGVFAFVCAAWLVKALFGLRNSASIDELIEIIKNK